MNHFIETYDPTIEDSYRKQVQIDGQPCELEVLDTAGQEDYAPLRSQWIRDGEGFLLVYSVSNRASFQRMLKLYHEVRRVKSSAAAGPLASPSSTSNSSPYKSAPVMLVGNKSDIVAKREISVEEGWALAKELGCDFVETSAKNSTNVEKAFYDLIRQLRRQEGQPRGASLAGHEKHISDKLRDRGKNKKRACNSRCVVL